MAAPRVCGTLEVIDAQVHLNQLLPHWRTAGLDEAVEAGVQAMDAVGIDRVLIGEVHGLDENYRLIGELLPNGAIRTSRPFSERAVEMYPDRFAYYALVDPLDPDLDSVTRQIAARPGAGGLRIIPLLETGEVARLERGEYDSLFAAAERYNMPVFAWVPSRAAMLVPYAERFSNLQLIVDHTGVGAAPLRSGRELPATTASSLTEALADRIEEFARVCEMARYPNIWLKWSHAPMLLTEADYPYADLLPLLRQAIDAFGAERIMWASDYTIARVENGNSWAQCLYYLVDSGVLSRTEKEWILGGSVRRLLER